MTYADAIQKYKELTTRQKIAVYTLCAILVYILDAWLVGSATLIFYDWSLSVRCLSNPLLAAIEVPAHASLLAWFLMNLMIGLLLTVIAFSISSRYPELYQRLFRKESPDITNDPTCGTSNWMTKDDAKQFFDFGYGPGILLDTQRYISDMLGTATVEQLSYRRRIGTFERAMIVKGTKNRDLMALSSAMLICLPPATSTPTF